MAQPSKGLFLFMRLPQELRLYVAKFLLPDMEEIKSAHGWYSNWPLIDLAITQTNRQNYAELSTYFYGSLKLSVRVSHEGIRSHKFGFLHLLPLGKIKSFCIEVVAPYDQQQHIFWIRKHLLALWFQLNQVANLNEIRVIFHDYEVCWDTPVVTGEELFIPDINLLLQPLSLLSNLGAFHISMDPALMVGAQDMATAIENCQTAVSSSILDAYDQVPNGYYPTKDSYRYSANIESVCVDMGFSPDPSLELLLSRFDAGLLEEHWLQQTVELRQGMGLEVNNDTPDKQMIPDFAEP